VEKLEEKLVQTGWITPKQFIKAKQEQAKSKKTIFSSLIKLGYLTEEDIFLFFSQHSQIPLIKISDYQIDPELLNLFSEEKYREYLFVPLFKIENTLYIGMANPLDTELLDILKKNTELEIYPLFAPPSSILEVIDHFFGPDDRCYSSLNNLILAPQTLNLVPFWRESERISLKIPVEIKVMDERIKLNSSGYICGTGLDISRSGKAMGIETIIFLPSKVKINIRFPSEDPSYEAKAEIVRCNVGKKGKYFLGIRFIEIKEEIIRNILKEEKNNFL
jgi:hypothetical protein